MSIFSINTPKRLIGAALLFSLTVSAGAALSLYEMRLDALKCAKDAGANIALIIERDVARNLELYSLSVEAVLERLADPEVHQVSNHIRRLVLFDGIAQARDLGSILVTDTRGQVILDSKAEPRATSTLATATISGSRPASIARPFSSASRSRHARALARPSRSAGA